MSRPGALPPDGEARATLGPAFDAELDERLAASDAVLERLYPGDDGSRQPVHTVYVPGDRYRRGLPAEWGAHARAALARAGGALHLAAVHGVADALALQVAPLVDAKLAHEPIEDLRIDFEDGFGHRCDALEDDAVRAAARELAAAVVEGSAPPFVGLRIKSLERATRRRGVRTLDLFVTELVTALDAGPVADGAGLPPGFVVTLAKVQDTAQVEAMVAVCERLERALGLGDGALRFEIQVETPQAVLGPDGAATVARMVHAAGRRAVGLHYGTYDYSASLGIAAGCQSTEHPAADHAKAVMQVAAAGTGVRLSDGSTNVLPVGDTEAVDAAWVLHGRLVRRSLERGFYQGWDLHPGLRRAVRHRGPRRAGHGEGARVVRPARARLRGAERRRGPRRRRAGPARAGWFRGNYPPYVSVEATSVEGYPSPAELHDAPWTTIVAKQDAAGDTENVYEVADPRRWTHVRLTIYPDGGVARLRVHGEVVPDPRFLVGTVDLLAAENGGRLVETSDAFYSSPANVILPGRAAHMGEGWENARRRGPGNDSAVFALAARGVVRHVEVDTSYFVGNAPGAVRLQVHDAGTHPGAASGGPVHSGKGAPSGTWTDVLPRTDVQADTRHRFVVADAPAATHLRLDVYPDGGLARLRAWGELGDDDLAAARRRWWSSLPEHHRARLPHEAPR